MTIAADKVWRSFVSWFKYTR